MGSSWDISWSATRDLFYINKYPKKLVRNREFAL